MSTTNGTTPSTATLQEIVQQEEKQAPSKKQQLIETKVSHDEQHSAVALHNDTLAVVSKMFAAQSDFENESKYLRTFMHTAVLNAAKAECRRIANAWENAVSKVSRLHPTMTREQCEAQLLESKKNREIKAQVEIAVSLLKDEFKS